MVEIEDIVDRESLEGWLRGQPKEVSIWIARRAAIRVLPDYWEWSVTSKIASELDLTTLPILRFYLILGIARKMPTSEIAAATTSATAAYVDAAGATYAADATAYIDAAYAADYVATATDATTSAAAAYAGDAATYAGDAAAFWTSIRADCQASAEGSDLDGLELWAAGDNPLVGVWTKLKVKPLVHSSSRPEETARGDAPVDWSFWIKWYDSVLAGEPLNGDMLEEIALIEPAEWEKGALHINNEVIAGIVEKYRLLREVQDLRKDLGPVRQMATAAAMGHNNPPEGIDTDAEAVVITQTEIIWTALGEAEEELSKPEPSPSVLTRAGTAIFGALKTALKYCAGLVDSALKKAAEEGGAALGKWGVRGLMAWLVVQEPHVASISKQLLELASSFLK